MSEFKDFSELQTEATEELNIVKLSNASEDLEQFPSFAPEKNNPIILKRNYRFKKDKNGNRIEIVTREYDNGAKVITEYKEKGQTSKTEIFYCNESKSRFTVKTKGEEKRWSEKEIGKKVKEIVEKCREEKKDKKNVVGCSSFCCGCLLV